MAEFTEIECCVNGMTLRGRRWGEGHPQRVLALHGWLDNCASFMPLADELWALDPNRFDLIAIDLAGHGRSDHRPGLSAYNIWQDLIELEFGMDALGWGSFSLLGHSRGALIASLFAVIYPQRVAKLALIEGLIPAPVEEQNCIEQLRLALEGIKRFYKKPNNYYASFDAAVKARQEGFTPLNYTDAELLSERGVRKNEHGYYWSNDSKLLAPSEVKFTSGMVDQYLQRLAQLTGLIKSEQNEVDGLVPLILINAKQGLLDLYRSQVDYLAQYSRAQIHYLAGDHHLHMSQGAKTVAPLIQKFFE